MKIKRILLLGLMALILACCATPEHYAQAANSWKGASFADLLGSWGYPEDTEKLENGNTLYTYNTHPLSSKEEALDVWSAPMLDEHPVVKVSGDFPLCKTRFEVNNFNRIVNVEYEGPACKARPLDAEVMGNPKS